MKHVLDLMSLYKLNKFHWHLSDDQGWRIEIEKYPLLTEKGAWRKFNTQDRTCMARAKEEDNTDFLIPEDKIRIVEGDTLYGGYYTHDDIKEIVAYATQEVSMSFPRSICRDISWQLSVNIRNWCVTD